MILPPSSSETPKDNSGSSHNTADSLVTAHRYRAHTFEPLVHTSTAALALESQSTAKGDGVGVRPVDANRTTTPYNSAAAVITQKQSLGARFLSR